MKTASLALVIPLAAVLAGGVSGFVQHALAPAPAADAPIAPPVELGAFEPETAVREGLARLESIERLLRDRALEGPSPPDGRDSERRPLAASASAPPSDPTTDLDSLEALIERIERVERRMAQRAVSPPAAFATQSPLGELREADWVALDALFSGEPDGDGARLRDRYLFTPLGRIVSDFGRPDFCQRLDDGELLLGYQREAGQSEVGQRRRVEFRLSDGFVIEAYVSGH